VWNDVGRWVRKLFRISVGPGVWSDANFDLVRPELETVVILTLLLDKLFGTC
jgi:hypothetical protein